MSIPHSMKLASLAVVAGVLAACGGGGGGLQDVSSTPVAVTIAAGSAVVTAGKSFMAGASAVSKPAAMKTMSWVATTLVAGAAPMTVGNTDCASGTRTTRSLNGITQSNWACDSVVTAPSVLVDTPYRLTFTGIDESGNASSGHRDIVVSAGQVGPATKPPIATTPAQLGVVAGADVGLNCFASGGTVNSGSKYVLQWVVKSNPDGLPLALVRGDSGALSFKAPAVKAQAQVTLQCRVTDDALASATSDTVVSIKPGAAAGAIANAGPTQSVRQGDPVILDGTASIAPGGAPVFYKWTQVEGPVVALSNVSASKPTFVSPAVTQTTRLSFQLAAMATAPADPALAAPSELAVASVFVMPLEPLTLSISAASVVPTGTAVRLDAAVSQTGSFYYAWTQVSGPAVTLGGANTAGASFIAPSVMASPVDAVFSVSVSRKPLAQSLSSEIVTADVVVRTTP